MEKYVLKPSTLKNCAFCAGRMAGAAFGDPGHTAAERATLDDLAVEILGELKKKETAAAQQQQEEPLEKAAKEPEKGAADQPPVAPKAFQKPEPQKSARCSGWTFWKGQKLHSPPKAPTEPRSRQTRQSLPASCMCAAKSAAGNAAFAQRHRFPRVIAGSAAGKRSSKICARSRSGASAAAPTATTRTSRTLHLICPA